MPAKKTTAKKAASKKAASSKLPSEAIKVRVELLYTNPPIWREVLVSPAMKLTHFCRLLQDVMGWVGGHLDQLIKGRERYTSPSPFEPDDPDDDAKPASKFKVSDVLTRKGSKCHYLYDFGDSWEHEITVIETGLTHAGKLPVCVAGARACPPEDCGGNLGYEDLCAAMTDKKHPERENLIEWLGEVYDPEAFDLDEVNQRLC